MLITTILLVASLVLILWRRPRKGADYVYDAKTILTAMHDWNGGDVDQGAKVALVAGKKM